MLKAETHKTSEIVIRLSSNLKVNNLIQNKKAEASIAIIVKQHSPLTLICCNYRLYRI